MSDRVDAETYWATKRGADWLGIYQASVDKPWRLPFAAALAQLAPFTSALDLGCHCGVLVPALETASPDVQVYGVDINIDAVQAAKRFHPRHLFLHDSLFDWLPFAVAHGRRWDIVVSSTCLAYMPPLHLPAVVADLTRLAHKGVVLQEPIATPRWPAGRSPIDIVEWRHDYVSVFLGLGWQCVSVAPQNMETTRPSAVMQFVPGKDDV